MMLSNNCYKAIPSLIAGELESTGLIMVGGIDLLKVFLLLLRGPTFSLAQHHVNGAVFHHKGTLSINTNPWIGFFKFSSQIKDNFDEIRLIPEQVCCRVQLLLYYHFQGIFVGA